MTPETFEKKWDSFENSLVKWLSQSGVLGRSLAVAALAAIFYFLLWPSWHLEFPTWSRFNVAQDRTWPIIALISFGFLYPFLNRRSLGGLFLVSLTAAWLLSCWKLGIQSWLIAVYPTYILFNGLTIFLLQKNPSRNWRALGAAVAIIGFALSMWAAGSIGLHHNAKFLPFFWLLHPEYVLFSTIFLIVLVERDGPSAHRLAWAPALISNPLPLPPQTLIKEKDLKNWWRGIYNIALNLLLLRVSMFLAVLPLSQIKVVSSLHQYIYFFIIVIGAMNLSSGLLRIFGLQVPDATRFLFLANSPLDVWRRGSVYVYNFTLQIVFLPTYRLTRSLLLTGLVTFIAVLFQMFLFHEIGIRAFYGLIFPEFRSAFSLFPKIVIESLTYGFSWIGIILLYQFLLFPQFKKRNMLGQSWLPIFVTHGLVLLLSIFIFQ